MKSEPTPTDREVLTRLVERVTYRSAENGFCVVRVRGSSVMEAMWQEELAEMSRLRRQAQRRKRAAERRSLRHPSWLRRFRGFLSAWIAP
jgi:hypothetical protein